VTGALASWGSLIGVCSGVSGGSVRNGPPRVENPSAGLKVSPAGTDYQSVITCVCLALSRPGTVYL
jgi:hypothetical protein